MTIFDEIETTIPNMMGWCSVEKAKTMAMLVMALKPMVCIEIGVFAGRSAIPIAMALKQNGFGKLIAIDAWSAEASIEAETDVNKDWWGTKLDYGSIYNQFVATMTKTNVRAFVEVIRGKSQDYKITGPIDFAHIDGNHSDPAIADVAKFGPAITKKGIVVMDDLDWVQGKVVIAAENLKRMGFQELFRLGSGAVYQNL